MFGNNKEMVYKPDISTQMQQFAICLKRGIGIENDV